MAGCIFLAGCPESDHPHVDPAIRSIEVYDADLQAPIHTVISLDLPAVRDGDDSAGGILVADIDNDQRMDYLVTAPGHVAAYANDGTKRWTLDVDLIVGGSSEHHGLPGHHGPGVAVGDVDGDGQAEVLFLTRDRTLHVVNGITGQTEATAQPPVPDGAERWEQVMIADFRGEGDDRDLLLQATNTGEYRVGRFLAAYAFDDLVAGRPPSWTADRFESCDHNGARLADLDGDGRDEVIGRMILNAHGDLVTKALPTDCHIDSVFVADVQSEWPGLEVVMLEEGANHVQLVGPQGPIWRVHHNHQEPQNAAVGRFASDSDGYFIWCRSRHDAHQTPFVFDADGNLVAEYKMDDVAPDGWTIHGIEVIHTIDWTGKRRQLACAKERHRSGDVCLFDPISGKFLMRIPQRADRLYVADVTGDWREEIIVLAGNQLHVYANPADNPRPDQPRLWDNRNYRRLKQCHNYYSP